MKSLVFGLLAVCLSVFSVTSVSAKSPGEAFQLHIPVVEAIATEDTKAFFSLCHPALIAEIDAPVLEAWMQGMNNALGKCQYEVGTENEFQVRFNTSGKLIQTKLNVRYEKGDCESSLTFQSGKLIGFNINTDQLKGSWFDGPTSGTVYFERSKEFLLGVISQEFDLVEPMMHEALAEASPREKTASISEIVRQWVGDVEEFKVIGAEFTNTEETDSLEATFQIQGSNGSVQASTKFVFIGLKGHLVSYNYAEVVADDEAVAAK